jgi:hypothetical protein
LKTGQISFVPDVQIFVFEDPLLSLPKVPLLSVKPVEGEIDHINFGFPQVVFVGIAPPSVVLVKQIGVLVQAIGFGIVKLTIGDTETRIGTTLPAEVSQGFEASIFAENEF